MKIPVYCPFPVVSKDASLNGASYNFETVFKSLSRERFGDLPIRGMVTVGVNYTVYSDKWKMVEYLDELFENEREEKKLDKMRVMMGPTKPTIGRTMAAGWEISVNEWRNRFKTTIEMGQWIK